MEPYCTRAALAKAIMSYDYRGTQPTDHSLWFQVGDAFLALHGYSRWRDYGAIARGEMAS